MTYDFIRDIDVCRTVTFWAQTTQDREKEKDKNRLVNICDTC